EQNLHEMQVVGRQVAHDRREPGLVLELKEVKPGQRHKGTYCAALSVTQLLPRRSRPLTEARDFARANPSALLYREPTMNLALLRRGLLALLYATLPGSLMARDPPANWWEKSWTR